MSRMLFLILAGGSLAIGGCSKAQQESCQQQCVESTPAVVVPEPQQEGIIRRSWPAAEVKCSYGQPLSSSPYFDSYSYLDEHFSVDDSGTWNKNNAKRAFFDPFYTITDIIIAPFSYGYNKYQDKDPQQDVPCQENCDPNSN